MSHAIMYNNSETGCNNTPSRLINNVLEYAMTKLMVTDFPHIKATKKSIYKRKSIFVIGINDSDYITQPFIGESRMICPFYSKWKSMIERCYSKKALLKRPTYIGCTVTPEWHTFMNFRAWMIKQDWKGKQLDKDILVPGNKVYSPDTCIFVTQKINTLLLDAPARRGKYPQGVNWNKRAGKFVVQVGASGEKRHVGYFNDVKGAHTAARKAKAEHIVDIAQTQPEPIRSALLHHAKLFSDGCDEKIKLRA